MKLKIVILVFSLGLMAVGTIDILPLGLKNNMRSAVLRDHQTSKLSGLESQFRRKAEGVSSELESFEFNPQVHSGFSVTCVSNLFLTSYFF